MNIDESSLKKTSYYNRTWGNKSISKFSIGALVNPSVSVIAAIDTEGGVFFSASTTTTDKEVM